MDVGNEVRDGLSNYRARRTGWARLAKKQGGRSIAPRDDLSPFGTRYIGVLYVSPALILFSALVLIPFLQSFCLAFYSWDGLGERRFVGLANFVALAKTDKLRAAFLHAFVLIFFYSILTTGLALLLVGVLARSRVRGASIFQTLLFIPYIIAPTAVATIWRWILSPDGPLNSFLALVGLGNLARPWLGDFTFALPAVGLVGTWTLLGVALSMLLAGVQKIPQELYDAARVDGASAFREFMTVTLPGLRAEVSVVLVLTTTAALRSFDTIYVLTQGGPGGSTVVPSWLVYNEAFVAGRVGAAAAVGIVLLVAVILANVVITRLGRR
ncbi:carbohydrate ABC transporter permease [Rhizobium miluonense]|uniref:Multiple sugar transport system permease protein n=1 Tax=Rhizobium miluonense TaxID=411945 RepID=A0A1C3V7D2_9HYPH|nr:sugar ABC transporter permease [Rhizobium miluonense]SCB23549.1 multiple sugar transport system permease protein [Rhizobium miluonense]